MPKWITVIKHAAFYCIQVTSLHRGSSVKTISNFFKIGNGFHVTLRILSLEILFK